MKQERWYHRDLYHKGTSLSCPHKGVLKVWIPQSTSSLRDKLHPLLVKSATSHLQNWYLVYRWGGIVCRCIPHSTFQERVWLRLQSGSQNPAKLKNTSKRCSLYSAVLVNPTAGHFVLARPTRKVLASKCFCFAPGHLPTNLLLGKTVEDNEKSRISRLCFPSFFPRNKAHLHWKTTNVFSNF